MTRLHAGGNFRSAIPTRCRRVAPAFGVKSVVQRPCRSGSELKVWRGGKVIPRVSGHGETVRHLSVIGEAGRAKPRTEGAVPRPRPARSHPDYDSASWRNACANWRS